MAGDGVVALPVSSIAARRIFDAFDTSRVSGLGLIIVRGLIGVHGGKVEALAGDGGIGTTVRVTLPLVDPPGGEARGADA